ncbi:acetate/propionate family kinase [Abyssalbus ytuae]|uniref:Acetate kinase n=1 Tax=Abyssalbus ytuae TaxID=2926907 RepID=A0A9E6ZQK8_9FLAO|nr:acetate kinase [Abyssalbus ytuae]UOB16968.1 acetate kinase [Abyssalbus ytuae]
MSNILIINSGSSSLKFKLINMPGEKVLASGVVERIGLKESLIFYESGSIYVSKKTNIPNHSSGLKEATRLLMDYHTGVIKNQDDIAAIGHRVVHGGDLFYDTCLVDKKVKEQIKNLFSLAPLHNPPNLTGIEVAEEIFPNTRQIAVFDTAFHKTIPLKARKYAIPNKFFEEHKIELYGFHGISHKYVSQQAIEYINKPNSKIISIHLGNGCSMTAVKNGESIDHSLGFGPNNGLIMGTRSGDIDQSVIFFLIDKLGYSSQEANQILNKQSGMLGLTGNSDLRDIEDRAYEGDESCKLALEMNAYRIKKYIGAYAAIMNGLDAIIFTAGIGENSSKIRELVCKDMEFAGIELDNDVNEMGSDEIREINKPESKVKILVIPTNEELEIAKQCYQFIQ